MDKGSIATLKAAIIAVLNNTVPDQSIEPDDHNTLLDDLLDTVTGLDKVLRANNKTGGYSLEISAGDLLKLTSGTFTGDISPAVLTGFQNYEFQDASGVVAFLTDIPAALSNHSGLTLDDGTNPHATTKTDVGLSNVPNTNFTSAVALNTAKNTFPEAPNDGIQYARKDAGWEAVAAAGGTNFANTYFVDPNGNDGTGALGNNSLPFLTQEAARDRAVIDGAIGKLIIVNAGTYTATDTTTNGLAVSGLNWYYHAGAIVNKSVAGAIHRMQGFSDPTSILGYGQFNKTGTIAETIFLYNTNCTFEFETVTNSTTDYALWLYFDVSDTYVMKVSGRYILSTGGIAVASETSNDVLIDVAHIKSTAGAYAVKHTSIGGILGEGAVYTCSFIESTTGHGVSANGGTFIVDYCKGSLGGYTFNQGVGGRAAITGSRTTSIEISKPVTVNFSGYADSCLINHADASLIGGVVFGGTITTGSFIGTHDRRNGGNNSLIVNGGYAKINRSDSVEFGLLRVNGGVCDIYGDITRGATSATNIPIDINGGRVNLYADTTIGGTSEFWYIYHRAGVLDLKSSSNMVNNTNTAISRSFINYLGGVIISNGAVITGVDQAILPIRAATASLEFKVLTGGYNTNIVQDTTLAAKKVKFRFDITAAVTGTSVSLNDLSGVEVFTSAVSASLALIATDMVALINASGTLDLIAVQAAPADTFYTVEAGTDGLDMTFASLVNQTGSITRVASYAMTNPTGGILIADIDVE